MSKTEVDLVIEHANQLVTVRGHSERPAIGSEMEDLGILEDAAVAIDGRKIVAVGKSNELIREYSARKRIDATGKVVTPGFVDPHTHLVFAGSREAELELKIKGAGYIEILQRGGGILRTVQDTRAASKEELLRICRERGENLLVHGTTTVEAKSGYGLTLEDEIKLLEVIVQLNNEGPLSFVPTFMGAHAIPPEFQGRLPEFVSLLSDVWIPEVAKREIAEFCDVFCEKGIFEIEESRRILEAGRRVGLLPRIHADEFYPLGGAELAAEAGAVSADHLLYASNAGLTAMKSAGVIATLLPAASLTLMSEKHAEARKFISERIPVALGSDLNPSCWLENHQLIIALACYKLRMTPAEAIVAATINAAHAIMRANEVGSLEVNKNADILILDASNYRFLGYRLGLNIAETVIKNGKVVARDGKMVA